MKLKSIKLAGFKTFVDPTKIPLQSNLVAILGPNGCGKSNVIDAIRWVMGESSAKQLRGESASDVIFNGSATRKPVGQALVELIFDNSDGSLGGPYAQYAEIAIKRQVNRDGQSSYYLNGSHCRRRDIVDIFLGTGLGPRSYAIIEQGTIARLIEAKPEELRAHIEEAAGISKYKERRRETELRMQHTRDNLQRLNDIREEISKQLERLYKQAQIAEKYKDFKQQERVLKAQLIASHWQILNQECQQAEARIEVYELNLEEQQKILSEQEQQLHTLKELQSAHLEELKLLETKHYTQKSALTQLEQSLQYQQRRIAQLEADLQDATQNLNTLDSHHQEDRIKIDSLAQQLVELEPQLEQAQVIVYELEETLINTEKQQKHAQLSWDQHLKEKSQHTQEAQLQQTKIQHMEQMWQRNEQRIAKLQAELTEQDDTSLLQQIEGMLQQSETHTKEALQFNVQLQHTQSTLAQQRAYYQDISKSLQAKQQQLQKLVAQQASLQTIQQESLGKRQHNQTLQWLQTHQLTELPRLAEKLTVEVGWERAVEVVLKHRLQAIGVQSLKELALEADTLRHGSITLLAIHPEQQRIHDPRLLMTKVQSEWPIANLLAGIYVASSLEQAWQQLNQLSAHESIVLADGTWLGVGWLHIQRADDNSAGLLLRERELRQLLADKDELELQIAELEELVLTTQTQVHELEKELTQIHQQANEHKNAAVHAQAQLEIKQARLRQIQQRSKALAEEIQELQQQQTQIQAELQAVRQLWQLALEKIEQYDEQQAQLSTVKEAATEAFYSINQQLKSAREAYQQIKTQWQTLSVQREAKQQQLVRLQQQHKEQSQRCRSLQSQLEEAKAPMASIAEDIQQHQKEQLHLAQQLSEAQVKLQAIETQSQEQDKQKYLLERQLQEIRSKLEEQRLTRQATVVRCQSYEEKLLEQQYQLSDVASLTAENPAISELELQLEKLHKRIQSLGAINLVAIEEYQAEAVRKQDLDTQHADLVSALTTLEEAIRTIDQETRSRFHSTFEQVNQGLQKLFPKLFGGGEAYLELTQADLLIAGVNIMARPPGKRNSTIHLLSGGEKALTAVALTFAIFQLNPAPFCILDEVDAPLDDANVARFGKLLQLMSDKVQFLFISHNKLTMEIAEQLIGVTMREPGISRTVAVDIGEALQLVDK